MSRYDDPSSYEEQDADDTNSASPNHSVQNGFYAFPTAPSMGNKVNNQLDDDLSLHYERGNTSFSSQKRSPLQDLLRQFLVGIALVIVAFTAGWFSHQFFGNNFDQSDQSRSYSQLIQQAWDTIDKHYVDRKAINYKQMSYKAISAMVDSLQDKEHTRFLTPDQVKAENQQLSGNNSFVGVGLNLAEDPKTKSVTITAIIPNSPAQKAGFKRGDVIIAINGTSVIGKGVIAINDLNKGGPGTKVTFTIQRPSTGQTLTIPVVREQIKVPNVVMHYIPEDHIAHIQIVQFADGVSDQLKQDISDAKKQGATKIILDLRDDPGGFLSEAVNVASIFEKNGTVLLEQDSSGQRQAISVNGDATDTNDEIVVLINGRTASAAEIVSSSLQDNGRAKLIGQKTFGTGTVLEQELLSDGSAIWLGTQEWLTPKGQFIRDQGIAPDIVVNLEGNNVPLTPGEESTGNLTEQQILSSGDAQLVTAVKYLKTH